MSERAYDLGMTRPIRSWQIVRYGVRTGEAQSRHSHVSRRTPLDHMFDKLKWPEDKPTVRWAERRAIERQSAFASNGSAVWAPDELRNPCLLYTSDAADDLTRV